MKRAFRKTLAVLLCMLFAFGIWVPFTASASGSDIPIVYIIGKVDVIYQDKDDPNSKVLYPLSLEGGDLTGAASSVLDAFMEAQSSDTDEAWANYGTLLGEEVSDIFADLKLAPDGHPADNSGIRWTWYTNTVDPENPHYSNDRSNEMYLKNTKNINGYYDLYDYFFHYDWRLDMYENAEILNDYINDVLRVTGSDKCVLISRCYGCNLAAAYLKKYGCDKIEDCILYCQTACGTIVCSEMFSGNFELNGDGIALYAQDLFGANVYGQIILSNLGSLLSEDNMDKLASFVNRIYSKIAPYMMPKTLINSFASMPGYWSMVNEDYYAMAKQFVFGDKTAEYSGLIDMIDYYHYTVTTCAEELFASCHARGMDFENVVKYGCQIAPMIKSYTEIADGIVEVSAASMGATVTDINSTFTADYLNRAVFNGNIRYISPDFKIDASTALYPDYTWFAEGVEHFDFPKSVDKLLMAIASYRGQMTVDTNPNFPQYTSYDGEGNLLTWASSNYINNSTDSMAKMIRTFKYYIDRITAVIRALFSRLLIR